MGVIKLSGFLGFPLQSEEMGVSYSCPMVSRSRLTLFTVNFVILPSFFLLTALFFSIPCASLFDWYLVTVMSSK